MKKIIIALAFLLTATLSNAQQVDTLKTQFSLSHVTEFRHDSNGDRYYILYRVHDQSTLSVKIYCTSDDFFDLLVWKNERHASERQMEIVYIREEREYRLARKERKGEA